MAVNPNDYLKVWLRFDESTTKDECGNTWTTIGTPTLVDGKVGKALHLNGSSQALYSSYTNNFRLDNCRSQTGREVVKICRYKNFK